MGVLRNTVSIVDGSTIADADVLGPQQRIRDFTNGNVSAANLRADAGFASYRLQQPASIVIASAGIPTLTTPNTRVLLHLASPAYFKGKPSELKVRSLNAYVGERVAGTATFTIDCRCFNTKENRWVGPDNSTADWQTLFTNPGNASWSSYTASLPRISNEDFSMLQMRVVITGGTVRGLAVYAICEATRLPD